MVSATTIEPLPWRRARLTIATTIARTTPVRGAEARYATKSLDTAPLLAGRSLHGAVG